jgi:hypothetical protein
LKRSASCTGESGIGTRRCGTSGDSRAWQARTTPSVTTPPASPAVGGSATDGGPPSSWDPLGSPPSPSIPKLTKTESHAAAQALTRSEFDEFKPPSSRTTKVTLEELASGFSPAPTSACASGMTAARAYGQGERLRSRGFFLACRKQLKNQWAAVQELNHVPPPNSCQTTNLHWMNWHVNLAMV